METKIEEKSEVGALGEKEIKCKFCGKSFISKLAKSVAKAHEENVHLGKGRKTCNICSKSFRREYLKKHILDIHSDNDQINTYEKLKCEFCSKTFDTKYAKNILRVHIKAKHSEIKTTSCEICGKVFKTREPENCLKRLSLGLRVCEM